MGDADHPVIAGDGRAGHRLAPHFAGRGRALAAVERGSLATDGAHRDAAPRGIDGFGGEAAGGGDRAG